MKYKIIQIEDDGFNNAYTLESGLEFKNIQEASKYLRMEYLTIPRDEEIIFEDGDDSSYTLGFNMFSEQEILDANPEIKWIDEELDEVSTLYYTIQEELV